MLRRTGGFSWHSPHAWVGVLCVFAIILGGLWRRELDLSPSDGLGYAFGIAGLSMMVVLLGYSARKRARFLRGVGKTRNWFEWHLVLGLLGPTLILFHSNFGSGSANATISLACVLAVSGSGVGGRFIYGRMHRSMAGERATRRGIHKEAREALVPARSLLEQVPLAADLITDFETANIGSTEGLVSSIRALWLRPRAWLVKRRVLRLIREADAGRGGTEEVLEAVAASLSMLCRAGELHLFEQLFALWHAIHIPLTMILFVSAVVHVVAVHLY
ncbi:MAG: hypothetical protein GY910_01920 [bacterium]|nr:hypothetical protein [bacterium]